MQTLDVLVAGSDIDFGQTVVPADPRRQTWPAATASNAFIRRHEHPEAIDVVRYGVQNSTTRQK